MRNCLLLVFALLLLPRLGHSQQPVEMTFEHDAAGNMIRCYVVHLHQPQAADTAINPKNNPLSELSKPAPKPAAQSAAPAPVEAQRGERTVRIYPNPTRSQLRVEVQGNADAYTYRLFSLNGQPIAQGQQTAHSPLLLDLTAHPAGAYLLHLEWPDDRSTYKIIKH